jgi:hypothetical protein
MKKLFMLFALLTGLVSWSYGQGTGEIWGRVIDAKTGLSIPGANVTIKTNGLPIGVSTDVNGYFKLKTLTPGTYKIEISFMGYGTVSIENINVYAEGIAKTDAVSLISGITLVDVIIRDKSLIGTDVIPKMKNKELSKLPEKNDIKQIIGKMSSEVQVTDDGQMYFRGARDNDFVYYIDGTKIMGDVKVPSSAIGSIAVYTGGVPARYGDFTGGCIVIETQSYNGWLNSR